MIVQKPVQSIARQLTMKAGLVVFAQTRRLAPGNGNPTPVADKV
jgi:hypothetical protein